jgi:hypothetical protein
MTMYFARFHLIKDLDCVVPSGIITAVRPAN